MAAQLSQRLHRLHPLPGAGRGLQEGGRLDGVGDRDRGTPGQVAAVAGSHTGGFLTRLVKPAGRGKRRRTSAKVAAAA
jgi:hypothetical protein